MPRRNVEATWDTIPTPWENLLDPVWELFTFFVQTFGNVKTREYENVYKKLDDEKKKKVVKLICMVKGEKFEETKYRLAGLDFRLKHNLEWSRNIE